MSGHQTQRSPSRSFLRIAVVHRAPAALLVHSLPRFRRYGIALLPSIDYHPAPFRLHRPYGRRLAPSVQSCVSGVLSLFACQSPLLREAALRAPVWQPRSPRCLDCFKFMHTHSASQSYADGAQVWIYGRLWHAFVARSSFPPRRERLKYCATSSSWPGSCLDRFGVHQGTLSNGSRSTSPERWPGNPHRRVKARSYPFFKFSSQAWQC